MKGYKKQMKRIMAMVLTLCMMLGSTSGYAPGWFASFAEEETAQPGASPVEATLGEEGQESEGDMPAGEPVAPPDNQEDAATGAETSTVDEAPVEGQPPVGETATTGEETPAGEQSPTEGVTSVGEETPAEEQASAGEGAASGEQTPAEEAASVEEETASGEQTSVEEQTPAEEETASGEQTPAEEAISVEEESPDEEVTPVVEETASGEQAPAEEVTSVEEETSAEEVTPVEEETASGEQTPVEEETSAEEVTPVEEETASGEQTPVEEETLAEEETPVEEETASGEQTPVEEETSAEEVTPVEKETASGEQTPAEEVTPVEEETDSVEQAPVEEDAPAEESASAVEESPARETASNNIEETPVEEQTPAEETAPAEEAADAAEEQAAEANPANTEELNRAAQSKLAANDKTLGVSRNAAANVVVPVASPVETETVSAPAAVETASAPAVVETANAAAPVEPETVAEAKPQAEENVVITEGPVFTMMSAPAAAMMAEASGGSANAAADSAQAPSALQTLIDNAMNAVTGKLTGRLKVVLAKDTIYDGEVKIEKGKRQIANDFELELTTEDVGEDGLQSEGKTTFKGNMVVNGINLIIRGLGIPGKVTVEGAKLSYFGSKADDTVNVELSKSASAEIQTGEGDDTVSATAASSKLDIQTGEGNDTVSATLSGTSSADIATEAGDDKVNVNDTATGKVTVDTGDDNDTVEVKVGAANGYNAGEVTVNTGDGDDSVTLRGGDSALGENKKGKITVDLGAGVNDATVSTDVAGVAPTVTINGENGNDHVHITGTLNSGTDAKERITGTKDSLAIASDKGAMTLALGQIESLTDDLKNKRTETLTVEDGKKVDFTYNGAEAFTNYVLKAPASNIQKIVVKGKDGEPLLLSSLVIDTATTWDGENKLVIPEGATIDAQGMTVRLTARDIQVDGTIKADTVQIEALDGTGMYSRNFSDLYSSFSGTIPVPGLDQAGSALVAGVEMAWDLVNINDKATITIGEKGAVVASNDVIMLAKVEQNGTLISLIPLNVVNVKVAHASIDIAGKVYAGVKNIDDLNSDLSNVEFDEGHGTVRANAQIKTTIGYDEKDHMSDGWPLAVSVVYANAAVNVKMGATVEAAGDVQLGTKSEVKAATRADSGLGGLPAAVAVAVLINDAHTTVNGTVNAKGGDVKLTANGDINARTLADKGAGQKMISGGYAAVTVALQDVKAELGKTAVVNAKGQAQVLSNAVEKVENRSTSGQEKSEFEPDKSFSGQLKADIISLVTDTILPKVVEYIGKEYFPDSAEKKLKKAVDKVSNGNHSVKLADNAQKHGDVSTAVDTMDGRTRVSVFVTPREGYKVKQVLWRGYNAGDDHYTMGEAIGSGNDWSFIQNIQNVMVFVKYEEVEAPETQEDRAEMDAFFKQYEEESEEDTSAGDEDISSLLDGLNSSINSVDDDEEDINEQLKELSDEIELVDLTRTGANGSILTLETENDDLINPLKKVYTGQKFELIPNPKDGYKLKNGGLTAMYHVTEKVDDKDVVVTKKVVINPDDQGRYYFEVPAKDKLDVSQGITIDAAFEKGEASKDADKTQLQLTGTVAVAVTDNDNRAVIAEGAQVNAGGVELNAVGNTDVTNVADGTAASKEEEKKKSDDYKINRPDSKEYAGYDAQGLKFGLLADATQNGSIEVTQVNGASAYQFTVEATRKDGYKVGTALVTYYQGGEKKTAKLEPDEDGKYHFNLAGSGLNADEGSTAVVSFGFVGTEDGDVTVSDVTTSAPQVIISNSIQIAYNALKEEKYDRIAGYAGKILYNDSKNKKDDDGNITAYAFVADPDVKKGYALDGKLTATYKDASGKEQTKELTEENGVWYLEMSGIPAGTPIKVNGKFKDDLHDFKVDEKKTVNGKVTLHDEKVKTSDKPKITVTPNAGFSVGDIVVTYKDSATLNEKTLKLSKGDLVQVQKDGKPVEGLYELKQNLPGLSAGDVTVYASFNRKSIGIYAGENDKDTDYTLSEKNAAKGDKVTVTPNDDKVKNGYKVTKVTVTDASGNTVAETSDGVFTVPENTDNSAKLTVKVQLGLKDIEIRNAELDHGKVVSTVARADRGEKVTVNIVPDANFRLKSGTLKAVVTDKDGNTSEVFASRQNDTTYTFDMPSDIAKDSRVSFIGDFEPGQSDSSAVETSLGAGIAVTVSNSETRADVKGRITSQGNVKTQAEITGGVKTEAAAGYSKGNIGMGGAVSVQVASMDAKALIHKTADITLDGRLIVDSAADIKYNTNADASGSKEAAKTGVGAGIAVAVNGSDVFAGVQDGASIDHRDDSEAMKGFSVTAVQKLKDEVKAKAGAAGGTAVVPVAAVDVIAAKANAYMGEAFTGKLKLTENAAVSAQTEASHTISADASASGKGAGVGGAFGVTVISDKATAKLAQSLEASQVTVAAQTIASVANTAMASASGGKTSGKSADKQADGLIGGASRLAGQNKSSGVSGNNIDRMTRDRQKGETSEGSVAVAGAVVVNVQNSTSRAEIVDGVDVKASGLLAVTALNGTTSRVKANASTTNSNVGVGVGVAVNIVGLQNIARMGNGEFEAAMLKVAANTKETTPEAKKAEASKAKDKDAAASELGEMVSSYMTDLAKEIGLDQYVPASLMGTILNPIVSDVTDSLLASTGLDKLFGDGGIQAKYDKAIELLQGEGSALVSLPEKLIEPMMEIVTDALDLGSLTDEQYTALAEALYKEFTQKLKDNLLDTEALGLSVLDTLKGAALDWVKKEGPSLLKGMFTGNQKADTWKKASLQVAKHLGEALKVEIKRITSKSFEQAIGNVKVPGLSLQNRSRAVKAFNEVKDSWKAGKITNIFEDAVSYVTDTFKEQVFDYEKMLNTLAETDFKNKIIEGMRDGAQKSMVNLTNGAISKLTSTLGVVLEAEQAKATGHVIETQAIAGVGAKDVGVAGSVAITVLNADTKATIADGKAGRKINVTGEMTVEANELRSVKNVASAAADAKGNAADNKSDEDKDNKNIGGNEVKSVAENDKKTVKLTVDAGGTAKIEQADMGDNRPKIHVTLKDGYKMPVDNKATYTYTDKNGKEQRGGVKLVKDKDGDGWTLDIASDSKLKALSADTVITLELKPEEVLHSVKTPDTKSLSDVTVGKDDVTLAVKGREPEKDGGIKARAGEVVEIHVVRKAGQVLNGIGYTYKDADGKVHEVELNPKDGSSTGKEKAFTLVTKSEKEYVYSFTMPDGDVTGLLVSIVKGEEEDTGDANAAATSEDGKKVGVGASFSLVYGDTNVTASAGNGDYTTGALNVTANSEHKENISSAAGTDPLSGDADTENTKDISVDATVALNILDNDIKATISKNATVKTTEGDLNVSAKEDSSTETTASAFSVGDAVAVGASVALNIANSDVKASMLGGAEVAGNATVASNTHSEDVTKALATAMGGDIARELAKAGEKVNDDLEKKANGLLAGDYMKADDKNENKTADKINNRLDEKSSGDGKSVKGQSTSKNALKTQDVKSGSGGNAKEGLDEGTSEANAINDAKSQIGGTKEDDDTKVMVAAAIGLTIASHSAATEVGRIVAGKKIDATSENTGNFNTMGTGAAMTLAKNANAIALGVAVSVNNNTSSVKTTGDIISTGNEDVNVTSKLTQNMDGDFAGKLAAQSLAGSVAGKDSKVSLAGAVSVVVSSAKSTVDIAGGTDSAKRSIRGGNITVEATDKSKLAARAGGLSLSTGASVGAGVASTTIVSKNNVKAAVGDNTNVKAAGGFKLNAEKKEVTFDDYKNLVDMRYLVTDSSNLTESQRENANTGLIDLKKGEGDDNYTAKVDLSTDKLLALADGLNFLSSQNTYAEAIAGSVSTGKSNNASLAGSFAVAVASNHVTASMGSKVTVEMTTGADVTARDGNNARVIAGSLAAGPSKAAVGATVAVMVNKDIVRTQGGDNITVKTTDTKATSDINYSAEVKGKQQVFTGAMSVAAGNVEGNAVGGAINAIVSKADARALVGKDVGFTATRDVNYTAKANYDLMAISGSAAVNAGGKVAAGGTVNVIVDSTTAQTKSNYRLNINAGRNATVATDVSDQLISGTASASVAAGVGGKSGAGVVNVIISKSAADTYVAGGENLNANGGDLKVTANNDAWMLNASLAATGATGLAVGAAVNVNVFKRTADVYIGAGGTATAKNDVKLQASGKNTDIIGALSMAGGITGIAISGNIGAVVENSRIQARVGDNTNVTAGRDAYIESYLSDYTVDAAGSIAASAASAAVGATVLTLVKNNTVNTILNASTVTANRAGGDKAGKSLSGDAVKGVYVGANAKETQFIGAAGVAATGGSTAVNGEVVTVVNNNKVIADASRATLKSSKFSREERTYVKEPVYSNIQLYIRNGNKYTAYTGTPESITQWKDSAGQPVVYRRERTMVPVESLDDLITGYNDVLVDVKTIVDGGGDVSVVANDDTKQMLLAGGVNASSSVAAGAAVVTLVSNKTVKAKGHDIEAADDVNVSATNKDSVLELAVSAGISANASVQVGAAVQVLKSRVLASVDGVVTSNDGNINVTSDNDTKLTNAGVAVAAALTAFTGAAVTPVGVVTYFQGSSEAKALKGAKLTAKADQNDKGGNITVAAASDKTVKLYALGATFSGGVGLSGTASVLVSKDKTKADVASGTTVTADKKINVKADSDYTLRAASAAISASVVAAAGINTVVSVLKSNTTASLGGTAKTAKSGGAVNVTATGKRDVSNIAASIAASSYAAGVTVMALTAGSKMSQDAADMIAYGSGGKGDGFDAKKFMSTMEENGVNSKYYTAEDEADADFGDAEDDPNNRRLTDKILEDDIKGNGHYESKNGVGQKDAKIDASSGYQSKDLSDENFNDEGSKGRGEDLDVTAEYVMYDKDGNVTTDESKAVRKVDKKDTKDIQNAKNLNTYEYTDDPDDAVIARITRNAVVASDSVSVEATQPVSVDMIGAAVGAGYGVGVGVSTVTATLHSNVLATSVGDLTADKVTVSARSKSGAAYRGNDANDRAEAVSDMTDGAAKDEGQGIRVIAATLGVGMVGVGVADAVLYTDNITSATLGGKVSKVTELNVKADHNYGKVQVATGALSGGALAAAGAAVAVAQANGTVKAEIGAGTTVTGKGDDSATKAKINVTTDSNVKVNSTAVTVGIGGIAINAGLALAINRLNQETGIRSGVTINGGIDAVNVEATSNTTADATLVGASIGMGALVLNAAVTQTDAKITTFIGESPDGKGSAPKATTIVAKDIKIHNDIDSSSTPAVFSLAAGAVAAGGNVLLAFNQTEARARLVNAAVTASGDVKVVSDLSGTATSSLATVAAGLLGAGGLSVNYADMRAENRAIVDTAGGFMTVNGNLTVRTGEAENRRKTTALAETYAATVGSKITSMNTAIARNNTLNYAILEGANGLKVDGNLDVHGYGESDATARLTGLSIGIKDRSMGTAVVALNDADARTYVKLPTIEVTEWANFYATQKASTNAIVKAGGGSLVGMKMTTAMAYGRSNSVIDVEIDGDASFGQLKAYNDGADDVKADISNCSFDFIAASIMFGAAYSQDVFNTDVRIRNGNLKVGNDNNIVGMATINTHFVSTTAANVTPSAGGLEISLGKVGVNVALARNTVYAGANLERSGEGSESEIAGLLSVQTQGSGKTDAHILGTKIAVDGAKLGCDIAMSDLSLIQAATLRVGNALKVGNKVAETMRYGSVNVRSITEHNGDTSKATATVGGTGVDTKDDRTKNFSVSIANANISKAIARENYASTAAILGAASGKATVWGPVDHGHYETRTRSYTDYETIDYYDYRDKKTYKAFYVTERTRLWVAEVMNDTSLSPDERDKQAKAMVLDDLAWQILDAGLIDGYNPNSNIVSGKYFKKAREYAEKNLEEIIPHYREVVDEEYEEWIEDIRYEDIEVDTYNPSLNVLNALSVSVWADGGKTEAFAKVMQPVTVSLATGGSLSTDAKSNGSFSAVLEGVTANIKGNVLLRASSETQAYSEGATPGSLTVLSFSKSENKAGVGERNDRHTAAVIIGEGATVNAENVTLKADNIGSATSTMRQGGSLSLGGINKSSQPTESWYNTLISIGANAKITANNKISITSKDAPVANSEVTASNTGLLMNFDTMMGKNTINQENNLDVGNGAKLKANGDTELIATQTTFARATTKLTGGGILSGKNAKAQNDITRIVRINLGKGVYIGRIEEGVGSGKVTLKAATGVGEAIYTEAYVKSKGLIDVGNAKAYTNMKAFAEINIDRKTEIIAQGDVILEAIATSYGTTERLDEDGTTVIKARGINTKATVESGAGIPVPNAVARNTLSFNTYININEYDEDEAFDEDEESGLVPMAAMIGGIGSRYSPYVPGIPREPVAPRTDLDTIMSIASSNRGRVTITSAKGSVLISATNEDMHVEANAHAEGKGGFGVSNATAWNDISMINAIWIDDATLEGDYIRIFAENGGQLKARSGRTDGRVRISSIAYSKLNGIGKAASEARISGEMINQIRSNDTKNVTFIAHKPDQTVKFGSRVITIPSVHHETTDPEDAIIQKAEAESKIKKVLGIPLGKRKRTTVMEWGVWNRCDFCGVGTEYDVKRTDQETIAKRYKDAFEKALAPINDIQRMVGNLGAITRARYGEEDYIAAGKLFVLEYPVLLEKNVTLNNDQIAKYRLWNNTVTYLDVYLLPNATRLFGNKSTGKTLLQYVAEVLRGDVRGNGEVHEIDIITALTARAFAQPVMPVGSTGTLNFNTGVLTLPSLADFELYLHEISSSWLLEAWNVGLFQMIMANQDAINECAINGEDLPQGTVVTSMVDGGEADGWHRWWIGDTPETAADADQTLIYLLTNAETDEVDAFRTSVSMLENGEEPVDVSLYVYRDSNADRAETEKYNVLFFDTPEDEKSLVKVVTDVLMGRELETPLPLRIVLRGFHIDGADLPVYSLTDHFFAMCDGTDGGVSMFDDFYTNRFDGDTFESDYIRIEGIVDGDLNVTIKEGQNIWPEWTGENEAEDIAGNHYTKVDGVWYNADEAPTEAMPDDAEAA